MSPADASIATPPRNGITLLEVLVACGILVVGLASLASVLPAAGSRLAQATVEDRAGLLATNAYAEIVNRGLASSDLFQANSLTKACVFGSGLDAVPGIAEGNVRGDTYCQVANTAVLAQRIDMSRGFLLEDDLVYGSPTSTETPLNQFFNNNAGPREYRAGICWGAMLTPLSGTAAAGAEATLSAAVFRKAGAAKLIQLAQQNGTTLFLYSTGGSGNNSSTGAADEQTRKQFLPGCSYVLALPVAATIGPKWLKIMSSWTNRGPGDVDSATEAAGRRSFVSLDLDALGANYAQNFINGSQLTVVAFENLVRVDQYTVSLE